METALSLLSTSFGQALLSAAVSQALTVANGGDPVQAAADFQVAVDTWSSAVAKWKQAETQT